MAASINNGWINLRSSNFMTQHSNKIANNVTRISGNTKFATGADNPAGFAFGQKVRSSAMIANQSIENVQNAQTKAKIADSAYGSMLDALSKAKDLAAQAASSSETAGVADAIGSLYSQISTINNAATFNGTAILGSAIKMNIGETSTGAAASAATASLTAYTGPSAGTTTVAAIQSAIESVVGYQAKAGALEAGLGYLNDFLTSKAAYMSEAEANANNVNLTTEMSSYVNNQIALQSAQYIAAQQNQNAYSVLNLLK